MNSLSNTKALQLSIITAVTILLILGLNQSTCAQGWLTSWSNRKSHLITGSSGAGTNYQIRIVAHKATGTDGGADVYMGTNVLDNFGDVRFTTSDGTTLLPYWLETNTSTSGSLATFWVKVAADLGSNQTIYIYYGNSAATTTSNGTNTFLLFDDFTGTSLDGTKWTKRNGGTLSFSSGIMTAPFGTDPSKIVATAGPTTDNNAIVARFQVTGGVGTDERVGLGVRTPNATAPEGYNFLLHNLSVLTTLQFLNDNVQWGNSTTFNWTKNTYYIMEACTDGTDLRGRMNYGTWNTQTLATLGTAKVANYLSLNIGNVDATSKWDWAFIRKCISTEPAHSTWGMQELPPITFSPASGCAGVTPVTITGINLTGATAVKFGGTNASSFTVTSSTQITATPAAGTTGTIIVTTPNGTATSAATFTINPNVVAGTVSGTTPLCIGMTSTYTISGNSVSGFWSSSNTSVADIGTGGDVTTKSAGTTNITYTISSGCGSPVTAIKALSVTSTPIASVDSHAEVNCYGASDGTITIRGSNGTSPYNYSVDNGNTWTPAIPVLPNPYTFGGLVANTSYRIKVKDSNGCVSK